MRFYQFAALQESRGFVARTPGEEFIDPTNKEDVATFISLDTLPSDRKIAYDSFEELINEFEQWSEQAEGTVYKLNKPISSMRGAMIVTLNTPRGLEHFVLFTKDIGNLKGKLKEIPPGIIPGHGGYTLNREVSLSEKAGLKPADILTSEKPVGIKSISALLEPARSTAGDEAVDQMQEYLDALAAGRGENYTIKNGAANAKLHQKYLGEWASPIALITGQFEPSSQLKELEEAMTNGKSLKSAKIIFNTNQAEALFDSSVVLDPYKILISTKAEKGGAAASLQGLYDAIIDKKDKFPSSFWRSEKAKKFKNIVTAIVTKSAIDGVLDAAELEGIITPVDKSRILSGIASERTKTAEFKPTNNLKNYMADYDANTSHLLYSPSKHALAGVARALCDKLNTEDYTDVVKTVLNYANVVQMYFNATPKGKDLVCKGFRLVWPAQFTGNVYFYSSKTFFATDIKGKLGFKIDSRGKPIEEPDPSLDAPDLGSKEAKAAKKAKERAVGKITKPGERDVRDISVPDVKALGRGRKK